MNTKAVPVLITLGLLAAASGAAPAAAALLAAAAALPFTGARAAGAGGDGKGDPERYYEKGLAYLDGDKVPQDNVKAYEAFLAAANGGHAGAQREMGLARLTGRGLEVEKYEAIDWFRKAMGQDEPRSVYEYSRFLMTGYGAAVAEDRPRALELLRKAAGLGCVKAQLDLARLMAAGEEGVEKDEKGAFGLIEKAAARDDPDALAALAEAYENGSGVDRDPDRAGEIRRKLGGDKG